MVAPAVDRPVVGHATSRHVLYQHFVINPDLLEITIERSFSSLYGRVAAAGVVPMGPPFVIYSDASIPGVRWDLKTCLPVSVAMTESLEFKYMELPSSRVVSLVHVGPYESLGEAYRAIDEYIAANNMAVAGPAREFYLSAPNVPPHQARTLVERPVE